MKPRRELFGATTAVTVILLGGASFDSDSRIEAMIQSANKAPFGAYLADGNGRSVYLFTADKPSVSNCYGACASCMAAGAGVGVRRRDGGSGGHGGNARNSTAARWHAASSPMMACRSITLSATRRPDRRPGRTSTILAANGISSRPRVARSRRRPRRNPGRAGSAGASARTRPATRLSPLGLDRHAAAGDGSR